MSSNKFLLGKRGKEMENQTVTSTRSKTTTEKGWGKLIVESFKKCKGPVQDHKLYDEVLEKSPKASRSAFIKHLENLIEDGVFSEKDDVITAGENFA